MKTEKNKVLIISENIYIQILQWLGEDLLKIEISKVFKNQMKFSRISRRWHQTFAMAINKQQTEATSTHVLRKFQENHQNLTLLPNVRSGRGMFYIHIRSRTFVWKTKQIKLCGRVSISVGFQN